MVFVNSWTHANQKVLQPQVLKCTRLLDNYSYAYLGFNSNKESLLKNLKTELTLISEVIDLETHRLFSRAR